MTRSTHKSPTTIAKRGRDFMLLLLGVTALVFVALGPDRLFACDVTDVDLWIGDTQSDAEAYNTADVWKCPEESFGWYVEWDAPEGDDDFEGEIYVDSVEVDDFTADAEDDHKGGAATVPSSMSGGTKTVQAWMHRVGGEWCASDTRTLKVVKVELECVGHPDGCTALADERICINAQDCYKKTKWKATEVKPSGTTAAVSSTGTAAVTFAGIDGSVPSALSEGDEFWVIEAGETGDYEITLTHNDYGDCPDTFSDYVFEFKLHYWNDNSMSDHTDYAAVDEDFGAGQAYHWACPASQEGIQHSAWVRWYYKMKVLTDPASAYGGNVKAKAQLTLLSEAYMTIQNGAILGGPPPVNIGVSVSVGPLSVSVSDSGSGTVNYGTSVAGADTEVQIGTEPSSQCGDVQHDYTEVDIPNGTTEMYKTKVWSSIPLSQYPTDLLRTYLTGSTEVDFWYEAAIGCNASKCIEDGIWFKSTRVIFSKISITTVEVEEDDGVFEITE